MSAKQQKHSPEFREEAERLRIRVQGIRRESYPTVAKIVRQIVA